VVNLRKIHLQVRVRLALSTASEEIPEMVIWERL